IISGPQDVVAVSPVGATQRAAEPGIFSIIFFPAEYPTSRSVVESASDAVAVVAITLTAYGESTGRPVAGSIMCPAELFCSRLGGVCSEVERLFSDSITRGSTRAEGSRRRTSHPGCPLGAPMA